MKKKPIYVEVDIRAPIDEAWNYTQNPKMHEQWYEIILMAIHKIRFFLSVFFRN